MSVKRPSPFIELLAPAANPAMFHAAIESGADAIYVGLTDFNARIRARNMTPATLSHLVPQAHDRGRKVYVTLNTAIKQGELEQLCHTLFQLEQIGVDAVIVADMGVMSLARKHFPRLALHASTQMSFHNSLTAATARSLGLRRVILARELTATELCAITKHRDVQYEVFVHGALCYSLSGYCLASSFLGGGSGNRGRCTQVCRRDFTRRKNAESGSFFSLRDLCAVDFIPLLRKCAVACVKIEGRMRSASYVRTVVTAWRRALDDSCDGQDKQSLLECDMGRAKTSFFFPTIPNAADITGRSGTGLFAGSVVSCNERRLQLSSHHHLPRPADHLRITSPSGEAPRTTTVVGVCHEGEHATLDVKDFLSIDPGDDVFITRRAEPPGLTTPAEPTYNAVPFRTHCPGAGSMLAPLRRRRTHRKKSPAASLWLKADTAGWLKAADPHDWECIVLHLDFAGIAKILGEPRVLSRWKGKIRIELPWFIPQSDIGLWRSQMRKIRKAGIRHFVCQHISQLQLATQADALTAGTHLWCYNAAAKLELQQAGFRWYMHTPEDDVVNMGSMGGEWGVATVFSHVPLFISRIQDGFQSSEWILDSRGERFRIEKRGGFTLVTSAKPLCLFHQKEKLLRSGWNTFCIDVSLLPPDPATPARLIAHWSAGQEWENSTTFNFRSGLR